MEISGQFTLDKTLAGIKAWIFFAFEPPPAASPLEPGARPKEGANTGIIVAKGQITWVRMASTLSQPIDDDGRLNRIITRRLELKRRPANNPLKIPEVPIAGEANSWLRYDDPEGRFHFNHPQELHLESDVSENPDVLELVNKRPTGTDVLIINIQREELDPVRNRQLLDPDFHIRNPDAMCGITEGLGQEEREGLAPWTLGNGLP